MKNIFFIVIIFLLPLGMYGQTDIGVQGFRGLNWGTLKSDFPFDLVKSKNKIPGHAAFDRVDEDFSFEGIKAHTITYAFDDDVFFAVNIGINKKDLDKVVEKFTAKYGEPKVKDSPIVINYEWFLEKSMISITYLPMLDSDKSVSIGIGKPQDFHEKGKKSKGFKISF
ncbi:MAG: hypothetical protein JW729_00140 [Bacteroidales bacterium]|nr:hypothetical protein [Bacteroidales bacterium]